MGKGSPKIDSQVLQDKGFLASLLDSVSEGICVLKLDLTIKYANKTLQEWCKVNAPIEGKKCFEVINNRTTPCENCPVIRCIKSGNFEKEIVPRIPGSSLEFIELSAYPIKNSDTGEITGVVEIIHDVTKQKQAEGQIRTQHSLIESLLDSSKDIIFFKDLNGFYIGCNDEFAKHVGRRKEDIVGKTDYDIYSKEEADAFRENDRLMLKQNAPRHNEEWISYPDGKRLLVDTLKTPFRDPVGKLIGILGISRDITERKVMEDKLSNSIKKKDELMLEIHHRVKNNLAIVSSLIDLQMMKSEGNDPLQMLEGVQKHLKAMGIVHNILYESNALRFVDMKVFVMQLVEMYHKTFTFLPSINSRVENVKLGIEQAVPAAMIINELFHNVLKHAFPQKKEGMKKLKLSILRIMIPVFLFLQTTGLDFPIMLISKTRRQWDCRF